MNTSRNLFYLMTFLLLAMALVNVQASQVETLSAGVGEEDRQQQGGYSLKVVTFVHGGPFLSNVAIRIKDLGSGEVLVDEKAQGPWLYVDLPAGSYSILAVRGNGDGQGARIDLVPGAPQREVALAFPAD